MNIFVLLFDWTWRVIYRVISPPRWRSGTVLSYKSMPHALSISLHLKRVQSVEGSRPVGAFRRFLLSQNMAGRSKMKQFVLVSINPTVAIIVSNSGTPSTDSAQPGICAATHSSRKAARRRTKNSTISIMDIIMIMMNRTRKKMTSCVIDI